MVYGDLLRQRLLNQRIAGTKFRAGEDAVSFMGAMQAQDFVAASWALGQRLRRGTLGSIEEPFNRGVILRTHVLRPTWHFVSPDDIRWLLRLTAPRVNAVCAHYYRKFGLDDRACARSATTLVASLRGGKELTRKALGIALQKARVLRSGDDPLRLIFLLLRAELDGLICSGPKQGKHFTYTLLEERVRAARVLSREDARSELARRYFISHGPATLKDFMWWSGLSGIDARPALESIEPTLAPEVVEGRTYYRAAASRRSRPDATMAYLIPAYDESLLSYRDSQTAVAPDMKQVLRDNGQMVIIGDRLIGTWRRRSEKNAIVVDVGPFGALRAIEKKAIADAVDRYGAFFRVAAKVRFRGQ